MRRLVTSIETWGVLIAAILAIVILPCLNAYVPEPGATHIVTQTPQGITDIYKTKDGVEKPGAGYWWWAPRALNVSDYAINLYGKYLCYAILAISVDLLWGYTGLLSLGQCLFFSLGGYMMGMYLMRMIGSLGQYKQPIPDFLWFLGWHKLPTFWQPFSSFPFALMMVFLLPGLLAFVFGYLAFRSRIKGVYFSILTQALTYAANLLFFRNSLLLGGNNGFTDFKFILGHDVRLAATQRGLYICTALLLLAVYALCKWLTLTKFGKIQRAIRDSENRVLFSGYSTANFKLFVFVLCALIAAAAGMLYVPQVGIINPSEMGTEKSIEAVVWVAIGGRGTLVGPIVGAIFVNALKSWATHSFPDLWPIILGMLFILVVLFMPGGIIGLYAQVRGFVQSRRKMVDLDPIVAGPSVPDPVEESNMVTRPVIETPTSIPPQN